jgi:UDP-galactopyranose mutase
VALPDATAAETFLAKVSEPTEHIANAADYLRSRLGKQLTDLFFRPYTKKMWSLDLEELDASVVKRIPLRFDDEDRYFPDDRFQMMPRRGYTAIFERILDHPNITVRTSQAFSRGMETDFDSAFLSMPIDEYYGYCFGPLPYRSIRFEHTVKQKQSDMTWSVTNYTDAGRWTRETAWHMLPHHDNCQPAGTHTREEPCDYTENNYERYYPVKTSDGRFQKTYEEYAALAKETPQLEFIGRCGRYQYLDMHQVINQSLLGAKRWVKEKD